MNGTKRCAVIGGNGRIGCALIKALPSNWLIKCIGRSGRPFGHQANVTDIIADVSNLKAISDAVQGCDIVFSLTTAATNDPYDLYRDIVDGARNVAAACRAHRVSRLVFTSSIAALYLGRRGIITEEDGLDSKPQYRNYYSRFKIAAENILQQEHLRHALPVVIVRPGIVLGLGCSPVHPGLGHWASNICCLGFGSGRDPLPFVLVEDVANALIAASTIPGIDGLSFNIVGDVRFSAREFIALLTERSLRRYRYFPYTPVRRLEHIAKWVLKLLGRKAANRFPWPRDMASMAVISRIDCAAARKLLNWTPNSSLERFLAEAVDSHLPTLSSLDLRVRSGPAREL